MTLLKEPSSRLFFAAAGARVATAGSTGTTVVVGASVVIGVVVATIRVGVCASEQERKK